MNRLSYYFVSLFLVCGIGCYGDTQDRKVESVESIEDSESDSGFYESPEFLEYLAELEKKDFAIPGPWLGRDQLQRQRQARDAYNARIARERENEQRWRDYRRGHRRSLRRNRNLRRGRKDKSLNSREVVHLLSRNSFFANAKGDVILDASLFRDVDSSEYVATCSSCYETIKLCDMFKHYNDTSHRFFYNVKKKTTP